MEKTNAPIFRNGVLVLNGACSTRAASIVAFVSVAVGVVVDLITHH